MPCLLRLSPVLWRKDLKLAGGASAACFYFCSSEAVPLSIKTVFIFCGMGDEEQDYCGHFLSHSYFCYCLVQWEQGASALQRVNIQSQHKMVCPWHWPELSKARDPLKCQEASSCPSSASLGKVPSPIVSPPNAFTKLLSLPKFFWLSRN